MLISIKFSKYAEKKAKKLIAKNHQIANKLEDVLLKLKSNPFSDSLHTHKVNSKLFGIKFSSRINGDLRLIWDFDEQTGEVSIIEIYDIGGHSGSSAVY